MYIQTIQNLSFARGSGYTVPEPAAGLARGILGPNMYSHLVCWAPSVLTYASLPPTYGFSF